MQRGLDPWVGNIIWRRERLPTPVFWPGESQGLYRPWGHKESDTTEQLSLPLLVCKVIPPSDPESLAGDCMLGCRFFPFISLNMSCHSILACRVSVEKSADSLMEVPFYVICCFPLVAFNTLYVFNFCQFDYYILVCSSLGLSCLGLSLLPGLG